jgi:heme-degrading monooxygenase HmoA
MKTFLATLAMFLGFTLASPAMAQTAASPDAVAVVIQITLLPGAKPEAAMAAMNNMRGFIAKQPGFLSGEFLQNTNAANSPAYVHVIRWASLKYWENVFAAPEFVKLNADNAKQFTVSASGFKTLK